MNAFAGSGGSGASTAPTTPVTVNSITVQLENQSNPGTSIPCDTSNARSASEYLAMSPRPVLLIAVNYDPSKADSDLKSCTFEATKDDNNLITNVDANATNFPKTLMDDSGNTPSTNGVIAIDWTTASGLGAQTEVKIKTSS